MTEDTFRRVNGELCNAVTEAVEALQTGEATFARAAVKSCCRALEEAERANPETCCLVREVVARVEGGLREVFTL